MGEYAGILFIGDPHLASRAPGFRRDDYPAVILRKLGWCLEYARERRLLPALLGDVFDRPRDNSNWVLGELLALLGRQLVIGVYGNHDCRENALGENDSLSVVVKAGLLRLVDEKRPWVGVMGGTEVVIGGTAWGGRLPRKFSWQEEIRSEGLGAAVGGDLFGGAVGGERRVEEVSARRPRLVFWLAHHDVRMAGYDAGHFEAFEMEGVDVVVNGHIHRVLPDVRPSGAGGTVWVTPGNIARIARSDMTRQHVPAVLEVTVGGGGAGRWERRIVTVPHAAYSDVFHPEMQAELTRGGAEGGASAFVQGLSELQARRTESGEGLRRFLELNEGALAADVRGEIWKLFEETQDGVGA